MAQDNDSSTLIGRLEARQKKLKSLWRDDAKRYWRMYLARRGSGDIPFNILYANTETLLPALFSASPRPEVLRRFTNSKPDERRMDEAVSQVGERILDYLADSGEGDYEDFETAATEGVKDALISGVGVVQVKYFNEDGRQWLNFCQVPYDRFLWGYATKWEQVPWVAFGADMTREDFERTFPKFARTEAYKEHDWKAEEATDTDDRERGAPTALVWQVWDHASQTISAVSECWSGEVIDEEPYPTRLKCRFPCAKPLTFIEDAKGLIPTPLYSVYAYQAEQLNVITRRLKRVGDAIRVRGVYNNAVSAFEDILNPDSDNEIVGSSAVQALIEKGGLEKHIWLLPIDMLVKVADALYQVQMNLKMTIFEISGIADVQRGASDPNETATAQDIKNRWGTVRMKKNQRRVSTWCRDTYRVAFEMASELFTPQTLASMTQLPYLFEAVKRDLQQAQAAMQRGPGGLQAPPGGPSSSPGGPLQGPPMPGPAPQPQAGGPSPGEGQRPRPGLPMEAAGPAGFPPGVSPGAPPGVNAGAGPQPQGPPQPAGPGPQGPPGPPTALQIGLQYPSWEQISARLRDDFVRQYTVDIETNSTVDLEATEDKQQISEFMNAFGQMMAGLKPLADGGMLPADFMREMLLEVSRRYRFGRRFDAAIEALQPPQSQGDDGKAQAEKASAQLAAQKAQSAEELLAKEQEVTRLVAELERTRVQLTQAKAEGQVERQVMEVDFAQRQGAADRGLAEQEMQVKMQQFMVQAEKLLNGIRQAQRQLQGDRRLAAGEQRLAAAKQVAATPRER